MVLNFLTGAIFSSELVVFVTEMLHLSTVVNSVSCVKKRGHTVPFWSYSMKLQENLGVICECTWSFCFAS